MGTSSGRALHVLGDGKERFSVNADGSVTLAGVLRLSAGPNRELLVNDKPVLFTNP